MIPGVCPTGAVYSLGKASPNGTETVHSVVTRKTKHDACPVRRKVLWEFKSRREGNQRKLCKTGRLQARPNLGKDRRKTRRTNGPVEET